jgi:hypothetical protein
MAKADNASLLERHLEKLVLLVCLAMLGVAAFHWVRSSPVALSIVDEQGRSLRKDISPDRVDEALARAAENIKAGYDKVKVPIKPVYPWANDVLDFRQLAAPQAHLIDPAVPGRAIKSVEPEKAKGITLAELENAIPVPPAPLTGAWIVLPKKAKGELAETVVAHGVLAYPMKALEESWKKTLGEKVPFDKAIVWKVNLQVQSQLPDGQWGPWKDANCAVPPAAGGEGKPATRPAIRDFTGKNIVEVQDSRNALGVEAIQTIVLRPEYYEIWSGTAWAGWQTQAPPAPAAQAGEVAVWFHDDTGLAPGTVYRFRTQLALVNPILTYPQAGVRNGEAEAKVKFILSKFGEPSEPTSVTRPVHFFLSGASATNGKMTVTVYVRTWGQWVGKTFQVRPGEMIGGGRKVSIRDPLSEQGAKKAVEVDFTTGAVAIRLDFNKALQVQAMRVKTAELVYLDKDGKVSSRILSLDERDEARKRLEEEIRQASSKEPAP